MQLKDRLLKLPRRSKRAMAVGIDIVACGLSLWLALYLRLGEVPHIGIGFWLAFATSVLSIVPVFVLLGLYRAMFRYSGATALLTVVRAVAIGSVPVLALVTMMGLPGVPRTAGLIQPILLLMLSLLTRALARSWLGDSSALLLRRRTGAPVAIYGAGSAGRQLCSALRTGSGMRVVAYLDDDEQLCGHTVDGIAVHNPRDLPRLIDRFGISDVLLALPSVTRRRRNDIIGELRQFGVHVRTLPALSDIARGRVQLTDLKELEIEDLLGRDPVAPNPILLGKTISDKVVLVTGAGGSIGSELCRQILAIGPISLIILDVTEFALYTIHQELMTLARTDGGPSPTIVPLLASVVDERRMAEILGVWRPHTVFHAAAYKHVPLVEHNVIDGVRNNALGTWITARLAREFGIRDFVLISTDKAVRPTNVMGASKRLSEMVLQAFAEQGGPTRFSMVRFGNVLGSSGSVVPLFRRQIASGGPVTVTHEEMTRYFMTIPEAAQLVIQAAAMSSGGDVFVLDMGSPVKIIDLARNMIELSGLTVRDESRPSGDVEIVTVGLRPGEKLYEELLIGDNPEPTSHPRIMRANERFLPWAQLNGQLSALIAALDGGDVVAVRTMLRQLVPDYQPDGDLVDYVECRRKTA